MFLNHLRSSTGALHKKLEENVLSRRLMSNDVSLEDYRIYLERLYGFVFSFEKLFIDELASIIPDSEQRRKSQKLKSDLCSIEPTGFTNINIYPEEKMKALLPSIHHALGGFYVLEGSTLGGAVIRKHLVSRLGKSITGRDEYFSVYGEELSSKWKEFLGHLVGYAERTGREEDMIKGASATFKALDEWFSLQKEINA